MTLSVVLTHLCVMLYSSKSQKHRSTSVAIPPWVLAHLWSCVGCNFKRKRWQQMSQSHLQVVFFFFFSQSLLTLKSLKTAFPMKNNFYLVLSTCIVAQTNRQITMWVHALIIYPPWRAINHEQMQQKRKINSGCIMLCIFHNDSPQIGSVSVTNW